MTETLYGLTIDSIRRTAETNRRVLGTAPSQGRPIRKIYPPGVMIVPGILVTAMLPARGPLTGQTCFTVRPITNTGEATDCGNDFEPLIDRINRERVIRGDAELEVDACDVECINRSIDANGEPGTFCKIDNSEGEWSWVMIDCNPSDEGLEAIVNWSGGGMGGGALGDDALGG